MRVDLLAPTSPAWRAFLGDVTHDFYHLPSYVALSASLERGEPRAFLVEDGARAMLLPVIVRRLRTAGINACDVVSPFGYPGPLFRGETAGADFMAAASHALDGALRERGVVSAFVRLHPILNREHHAFHVGAVIAHGETICIDLTQPAAQQWRETRHGHRYEITRARRAGHRAYIDHEWRHFDVFVRLYHDTMRRVGAASYYFFTPEYFRQLREALGEHLQLAVVDIGGEIAAAGLFTESCGIVQYHLSGMSDSFARLSPTKLMLDEMRTWARERGNRWMHLGGGLGAAPDSLFRFKSGFSDARLPFRTWRIVVDEVAYRRLVTARAPQTDPSDLSSYFPAYRRAGALEEEA